MGRSSLRVSVLLVAEVEDVIAVVAPIARGPLVGGSAVLGTFPAQVVDLPQGLDLPLAVPHFIFRILDPYRPQGRLYTPHTFTQDLRSFGLGIAALDVLTHEAAQGAQQLGGSTAPLLLFLRRNAQVLEQPLDRTGHRFVAEASRQQTRRRKLL